MYNYEIMQRAKNILVGSIILFLFLAPVMLFAQGATSTTCDPMTSGKICNPITQTTINGFIKTILEGILKIGIPIIALAIIYSGFLFVTAQGNTEKLTKAKNALLFSIVGAALVLGAWALAQLISETVLSL